MNDMIVKVKIFSSRVQMGTEHCAPAPSNYESMTEVQGREAASETGEDNCAIALPRPPTLVEERYPEELMSKIAFSDAKLTFWTFSSHSRLQAGEGHTLE